MEIKIQTSGSEAVAAALADIKQQAPYAMSLGLNAIANEAQSAIQTSLSGKFTLRRQLFVERTVYRSKAMDFATKRHLQASVRINPARDFLAQHEEGGQKRPMSGRNVAIPLPAVQPSPTSVVPKRLRPSSMLMNPRVKKITTPGGTFLVLNKPGRGRGGTVGWRSDFLYKLQPEVPLRPRLGFIESADRAIEASWERHVLEGIDRAIKTSR